MAVVASYSMFLTQDTVYKKYGSSCLASVTFWDAQPTYWLADADAVKAVTSDRFTFTKDVEAVRTQDFLSFIKMIVTGCYIFSTNLLISTAPT